MNKRTQKLSILAFCMMFVFGITVTPHAIAEEITITGNGAASESTVVTTTNNQTHVEQNNNANITNNVSTTTNTGNNAASQNTGGSTVINTGNAAANTTVSNQANQSVVNTECCKPATNNSVTVSGNGAGSVNNAAVSHTNTNTVTVNNHATINNKISTYANTGNNTANFNNGDVVIKTGDIKAKTTVNTGPINLSYIKIPQANANSNPFKLAIVGNGAYSYNNVDLNETNDTTILVNNAADIINELHNKYNTGGNEANFNNGDIAILTGDIDANVAINNIANISKVEVDCKCEKEKEKPSVPVGAPLPPTTTTTTTTTTTSTPGGDTPHHVFSGPNLPVTGNNWLILALFGNIMMLLLGAYLRLRSGRSPGFVPAL